MSPSDSAISVGRSVDSESQLAMRKTYCGGTDIQFTDWMKKGARMRSGR